uniref:Uncharacterized protein n=1 Tax=Romanomermis culicivorax TaxID=13658 RepID=A0A915KXM8_ROMCU
GTESLILFSSFSRLTEIVFLISSKAALSGILTAALIISNNKLYQRSRIELTFIESLHPSSQNEWDLVHITNSAVP